MPTLFKNQILQRLSPESIERLRLRPVNLPVPREIEYPGNRIDHLFFLESGAASMTTTFADGFQVEIALAGCEAVLGASSLMGTRRSLNRVYMQISGKGFVTQQAHALQEFKRGERFHDLTLRAVQAQFIQSAQTAGCNGRHNIEQRLARWLLLCSDRMDDAVLPLAHEFIADMLGVTRSTVSLTAGDFQRAKLIHYSRGRLQITNRPGLEKLACECYAVVRNHLRNFENSDTGLDE